MDQKRVLCTIIVGKTIQRARPSNHYIEEVGPLKMECFHQFLQMGHSGHKTYQRQFPAGPRKVVSETVLVPKGEPRIIKQIFKGTIL